jgi:hypothetical protein
LNSNIFKFSLVIIILSSCVFSSASTIHTYASTSQAEAREKLYSAENYTSKAFVAVAQAEEAGADITHLTGDLERILNLTEKANAQYLAGNYSDCVQSSQEAISLADNIVSGAESMRQDALAKSGYSQFLTVGLFIAVDIMVCAVGLWLIHRRYKRIYREFLSKKPEVVEVAGIGEV